MRARHVRMQNTTNVHVMHMLHALLVLRACVHEYSTVHCALLRRAYLVPFMRDTAHAVARALAHFRQHRTNNLVRELHA